MANRKSFCEFFQGWEVQHRSYLDKLLLAIHQNQNASSSNKEDQEEEEEEEWSSCSVVVEQVLSHYQEYYDEKSRAAEYQDIFIMFSPPWFTSLERTLLWATDFKPSVIFRLLTESSLDLSQQQKERICVVCDETRRAEREITEVMASVQESVAAPSLCGLFRREAANDHSLLVDGQVSDEMENAVKDLKCSMTAVMRDADYLRQQTAVQVLEVLTPLQKLKFLAGTSQFWLQSRRLGMDRERHYHQYRQC